MLSLTVPKGPLWVQTPKNSRRANVVCFAVMNGHFQQWSSCRLRAKFQSYAQHWAERLSSAGEQAFAQPGSKPFDLITAAAFGAACLAFDIVFGGFSRFASRVGAEVTYFPVSTS
jgi:hypothetical protein